jgi:hypothetical protein
MIRTLFFVVAISVLTTGCASLLPTPAGAPATDPLASLKAFTDADLKAALADAQAHNDQAAVNCWTTLDQIVTSTTPGAAPNIVGAASAFQAVRDLVSSASGASSLAKAINIGCAALLVDANVTLAKIGAMAVGVPGIGLLGK